VYTPQVSARKERGDFMWDEGGVSSKMGMGICEVGATSSARDAGDHHDPA
jgi:hypothetical protein